MLKKINLVIKTESRYYNVLKHMKCSTKTIDKLAIVEYNNDDYETNIFYFRRWKKKNEYMIKRYEKELSLLPKGKITPKITIANTYYYLKYRDGQRVCANYIGNVIIS